MLTSAAQPAAAGCCAGEAVPMETDGEGQADEAGKPKHRGSRSWPPEQPGLLSQLLASLRSPPPDTSKQAQEQAQAQVQAQADASGVQEASPLISYPIAAAAGGSAAGPSASIHAGQATQAAAETAAAEEEEEAAEPAAWHDLPHGLVAEICLCLPPHASQVLAMAQVCASWRQVGGMADEVPAGYCFYALALSLDSSSKHYFPVPNMPIPRHTQIPQPTPPPHAPPLPCVQALLGDHQVLSHTWFSLDPQNPFTRKPSQQQQQQQQQAQQTQHHAHSLTPTAPTSSSSPAGALKHNCASFLAVSSGHGQVLRPTRRMLPLRSRGSRSSVEEAYGSPHGGMAHAMSRHVQGSSLAATLSAR